MDFLLKFILSVCLCLLCVDRQSNAQRDVFFTQLSATAPSNATVLPKGSFLHHKYYAVSKSGPSQQGHQNHRNNKRGIGEEYDELTTFEKQLSGYVGFLVLGLGMAFHIISRYLLRFCLALNQRYTHSCSGRPIYLRLCTVRI